MVLGTTTAQEARQYRLLPLVMEYQEQGEDAMEGLAHGITADEALWVSQSMGQTPYKVVGQTIGGTMLPVAVLE